MEEKKNDLFYEQYIKIEDIAENIYGSVWKCRNIKSKEEVVVKCEHTHSKSHILKQEYEFYKILQEDKNFHEYIPEVYNYLPVFYPECEKDPYDKMIMELLGPNLKDLFLQNEKNFCLKTILMLAEQMITIIEFVHSKGIIHIDIKPSNFVIGRGKNKNKIYLIDFGCAEYFIEKDGNHVKYEENYPFSGTASFASYHTHMNIKRSQRDDLISLNYIFLYFLKGYLDWGEDEYDFWKVMKIKKNFYKGKKCFGGFPQVFADFFDMCDEIDFASKPDYDYLRNLFKEYGKKLNYEWDYVYEWSNASIN